MREPAHAARLVRVDWQRRRCWLLGLRAHHGAAGAIVTVAGVARRDLPLVLVGCALMAHDWADRREWFAG